MELKKTLGTSGGRIFEVSVTSLQVDINLEKVVLNLIGYEVNAEGENLFRKYPTLYRYYESALVANNETNVDPATGNYVDKAFVGSVGEWDYFWNIAVNVPVLIEPFILQTIEKNKARLMPKGFELDTQ